MRIKLLLTYAFLFTIIICAKSQYNNLLHKTYAERRVLLRSFYTEEVLSPQRNLKQVQAKVTAIANIAEKEGDLDLAMEAALMQEHIYSNWQLIPTHTLLSNLNKLINKSIEKKLPWLKARAESFSALNCFIGGYNYELTFQYAEQLANTIEQLTPEQFPEKQICYQQIASFYYKFNDWSKSIYYLKKGLEATPLAYEDQNLIQGLHVLGACYEKLNQLDSSDYYYKKALQMVSSKHRKDNIWIGILHGNLAQNLFLQNKYTIAIPLLQSAIDSGLVYRVNNIVSSAYNVLGAIYLQKSDITKATQYLQLARWYASGENKLELLQKIFPELAKLETAKGNTALAVKYLDSALKTKDSLAKQLNTLFILRGTQKGLLVQQQKLEAEKKAKTTERNLLIAFVMILMIASIYIYTQQRKRYQQKQIIKDLELEKKQAALNFATQQLNDFAAIISDNNKRVEVLQEKLGAVVNEELMTTLQESTILTDEEWEKFRKLFEQVHHGYLVRLKEKLPDLSPAEIRFMVLAKLKFSNKEMAAALGVSQQAIRITRYRLRKKINLPEEGSLEELVQLI